MKVGTDGVLLGAWASVPGPGSRVLDVGTGTGLTENIDHSMAYEKAGAGAIVLKSLFEEQILHDVDNQRLNNMYNSYSDQEQYAMYFSKKHNLTNYVNLIKKNKEALNIPVIASMNCVSAENWIRSGRPFLFHLH